MLKLVSLAIALPNLAPQNQAFSVNEQLRIYSSELWSLVLINNIVSKSAMGSKTVEQLLANRCADVNFDELFANLTVINKSNLQNVSSHF